MTCFMQPQADYEDGIEPDTKDMIFYLKQMKEQEAEVGLSLEYKNAGSLREKLDQDADFFRNRTAVINMELLLRKKGIWIR